MIWLFDSGHGGIINCEYQTAPAKMHTFPSGEIVYEGVINRKLKEAIIRLNKNNLNYIDITASELDLDLDLRVDYANMLQEKYGNCVYCSLHSNAGGGTGFEIFTSVGQTTSDLHASLLGMMIKEDFDLPFRTDFSDGDIDKESQFYVLRKTICPAWLLENLFFDNYNDYKLLRTNSHIEKLAKTIYKYQLYVENSRL